MRAAGRLGWLGFVAVAACGCELARAEPDTTWIDQTGSELVTALQEKDGPKFERLASKGLEANLGSVDREAMGDVIERLGALKSRTTVEVRGKAGEVQTGRYRLGFVRGDVELSLTLVGSEVVAFRFEGKPLDKALKEVAGDTLAVGELRFVAAEGGPHEGGYGLGEPVMFEVDVRGMTRHKGAWWIRGDLEVQDAKHRKVLTKKDFVRVRLDASGVPLATVSGTIKLTQPGAYRFRVRLRDHGVQDKAEREKMREKPLEVRARFVIK